VKVLVTGHKGFIGTILIERLKESGKFELITGYDLVEGDDILDEEKLDKVLSSNNYDVIIHLAAKTSVDESHRMAEIYHETNSKGTMNVVNAANKNNVKTIVYAATAASLDPTSSPYASSKLEAENHLKLFNGIHVALRFFNVVGKRSNPSYAGVIDFFRTGIKKREITIYGDGEQTRDFIHVYDVCNAIILACSSSESGTFQIGSGKEISINELAKNMIGEKDVKIIHGPARKEVRNSVANIEPAKKAFGFEPKRDIAEFFE